MTMRVRVLNKIYYNYNCFIQSYAYVESSLILFIYRSFFSSNFLIQDIVQKILGYNQKLFEK